MRSIKKRLKKLEEKSRHKPYGNGFLFTYDEAYAKAHPEEWEAFKIKLFQRFPDLNQPGGSTITPCKSRWVLMWPHPDGDEGSFAEYDKTDSLNTFEDWVTSSLSDEEYAEWMEGRYGDNFVSNK